MPYFSIYCANLSISGRDDMGVEGWWERMGVKIHKPQQYHL
jgi:hypothetical protein